MSKYFTFDSISTPTTATKGVPVDYDFVVRNMTPEGTQDCIVFLFNDPSSSGVVSVVDKFDIYPSGSMDITTTQHIPHDGTYHGSGKLKYLEVGTYKLQFRACYPNYYTGEIVVDEVSDFTIVVEAGVVPAYPTFNVQGQGEIRPQFGPYIVGQTLLIEAVPASGWVFSGWLRNGVPQGTENPKTFQSLQANDAFMAGFDPGVIPAYPTFSVEGQGEIRPQYGPYIVGQNLLILAVPASGWNFKQFLRNGIVATTDNPHTFLNLQENETFTAVFAPIIEFFTLTMASSEGGYTTPSVGYHTYPAGASVTIEAFPNSGWRFDHWEFVSNVPPWSGTDTRNPLTLFEGSLDRNIMVTPVFVLPDPTKKSLLILSIGGGSTNPASGTHQYNVGESVTVTATADSGWQFSKWTKDGVDAGSSTSITVVMDVNHTLCATFTQIGPEPPNTQWIVPALFIGLVVGIGVYGFWRYRK